MMKTQSTEAERDHEQHQTNKARLARYYALQRRIRPVPMDWQEVSAKYVPESWWLKVEAD